MNPNVKDLISRHLDVISWHDNFARVKCPSGKAHDDCVVYYSSGFVHDFHETCQSDRQQISAELGAAIGDDPQSKNLSSQTKPDPVARKYFRRLHIIEETARRYLLPTLPEVPVEYWLQNSPVPVKGLSDREQFLAFIKGIFCTVSPLRSQYLVWTGELHESGTDESSINFKTAREWLQKGHPYGQFISVCCFKNAEGGLRTRTNELLRFCSLVESDILTLEKFGGVVQYIAKYFPLRALILTGGRSIHALFDWFWFRAPRGPRLQFEFKGKAYNLDNYEQFPRGDLEFEKVCDRAWKEHRKAKKQHARIEHQQFLKWREFIRILRGLGCDPQVLANGMICRCPGVERRDKETGAPTGRFQRLVYLNPNGPTIL
jgi:hypothetical protein